MTFAMLSSSRRLTGTDATHNNALSDACARRLRMRRGAIPTQRTPKASDTLEILISPESYPPLPSRRGLCRCRCARRQALTYVGMPGVHGAQRRWRRSTRDISRSSVVSGTVVGRRGRGRHLSALPPGIVLAGGGWRNPSMSALPARWTTHLRPVAAVASGTASTCEFQRWTGRLARYNGTPAVSFDPYRLALSLAQVRGVQLTGGGEVLGLGVGGASGRRPCRAGGEVVDGDRTAAAVAAARGQPPFVLSRLADSACV